ncbi:hypothetical protein DPMN_056633 [Dreissena polymorpha]|uniref:Uncharacterized protein n=1 Tax=Dreissena polymorpha TaxID=45954 RepID=A0A9D4CU17_DREPO|nr:hypothetical protein DPMN_056633 [Dreissena polymorpha]
MGLKRLLNKETLNEEILSQTKIEGLEEEIFQTDTYSAELDIQLCCLRAFSDQQEKRAAPHTTDLPRVQPKKIVERILNQAVRLNIGAVRSKLMQYQHNNAAEIETLFHAAHNIVVLTDASPVLEIATAKKLPRLIAAGTVD